MAAHSEANGHNGTVEVIELSADAIIVEDGPPTAVHPSADGGVPPPGEPNRVNGHDLGGEIETAPRTEAEAGIEKEAAVEAEAGIETEAAVEAEAGIETEAAVEAEAGIETEPEGETAPGAQAVPAPEGEPGADGELAVVNYEDRLVEALPELARLAAVAGTRTVAWGLRLSLRAGTRMARATVDPQVAAELAQEVTANLREYAREVLGITDLEERLRVLTPVGDRFSSGGTGTRAIAEAHAPAAPPEVLLRAQGAELLRQSADVTVDDHIHPAFGRILGELAPDEGRILRLLDHDGPQPVVDVRATNLIGKGSQLVAQNLNMVAMPAGCRHPDRMASYLTNLQRLGLVCFSDEPLEDEMAYQVLEAQGHVLDAIHHISRAKTVQRTLRLTPFGEEFCAACLPRDFAEVQELTGDPGPALQRVAAPPLMPTEEELQTGTPPADELLRRQPTPPERR